MNVYQFRGNETTYIYKMDYYKATKKHDLDLYLLTQKDPHYREKLSPTVSVCILLRARKSNENKYLKTLTLITSRV